MITVYKSLQISHGFLRKLLREEPGLFDSFTTIDAIQRRDDVSRLRKPPENQHRQIWMLIQREENGRRRKAQLKVSRSGFAESRLAGNDVEQVVN
jgi:hypothetical protein